MVSWRLPVLAVVLELQQRQRQLDAQQGPATCISQLGPELLRLVAQNLVHADIEQARLVCRAWRKAFADATVTDMYMAMCADVGRSRQLVRGFTGTFNYWHHLHFWVPGSAVRVLMGTDGSTFQQHISLFAGGSQEGGTAVDEAGNGAEGQEAAWVLPRQHVRSLTLHYLDDRICPVRHLTQLSSLCKLELVDLVPGPVSLAPLACLPRLCHLTIEYKDISHHTSYHGGSVVDMPDLASISALTQVKTLEIALASSASTHLQTCFASDDMEQAELVGLFGTLSQFGGRSRLIKLLDAAASGYNSSATSTTGSDASVQNASEMLQAAAASSEIGSSQDADDMPMAAADEAAPADTTGAPSSSAPDDSAQAQAHMDPRGLMLAGLLSCSSGAAAASAVTLNNATAVRALISRSRGNNGPLQTLMSGGEFLVILLGRAWRGLTNLQSLVVRNAPCGMAVRHKALLAAMPSLTGLKLVGQDTRLREMYGTSAPSFKLELYRDEASRLWGPLSLSMSLHCPSTSALKASLHTLVAMAEPQPTDSTASATSAASSNSASSNSTVTSTSSATTAVPVPAQAEAHAARSAPSSTGGAAAGAGPNTPASPAVAAGFEGIQLQTLQLFLESPEHFKALKQLRRLGRNAVRELSVTVCWALNDDADSTEAYEEEDAEEEDPVVEIIPPVTQPPAAAVTASAPAAHLPHGLTGGAGAATANALVHASSLSSDDDSTFPIIAIPAYVPQQPATVAPAVAATAVGASSQGTAASPVGEEEVVSGEGGASGSSSPHHPSHAIVVPSTVCSSLQCQVACMSDLGALEEGDSVTAPSSPLHASTSSSSYPSPSSILSTLPSPTPASPPHANGRGDAMPISRLCFETAETQNATPLSEDGVGHTPGQLASSSTAAPAQPAAHAAVGSQLLNAAAPPFVPGAASGSVGASAAPVTGAASAHSTQTAAGAPTGAVTLPTAAPAATSPAVLSTGGSSSGAGWSASTSVPQPAAGSRAVPREPRTSALVQALGPRHVLPPLRRLRGLTSLTLREVSPPGMMEDEDGGVPHSRPELGLCPAALQLMARAFTALTSLEFQGSLNAPHASSLHHLSLLTRLRSLSLAPNPDDPQARLGLHCLPSSLTALTLTSLNIAAAPVTTSLMLNHTTASGTNQPRTSGAANQRGGVNGAHLPHLSHLHLKLCTLPTLAAFAGAANLEWLHMDNCETCVYLSEVVALWASSLSWLEITYTNGDWQLFSDPSELACLRGLRRLRKLTVVTPYEQGLGAAELLGLRQLRLLSLSPGPLLAGRRELLALTAHGFLAGLELKLYSDVPHHVELCSMAAAVHAELQEALPMTDVLLLVDDEYVDDRAPPLGAGTAAGVGVAGAGAHAGLEGIQLGPEGVIGVGAPGPGPEEGEEGASAVVAAGHDNGDGSEAPQVEGAAVDAAVGMAATGMVNVGTAAGLAAAGAEALAAEVGAVVPALAVLQVEHEGMVAAAAAVAAAVAALAEAVEGLTIPIPPATASTALAATAAANLGLFESDGLVSEEEREEGEEEEEGAEEEEGEEEEEREEEGAEEGDEEEGEEGEGGDSSGEDEGYDW